MIMIPKCRTKIRTWIMTLSKDRILTLKHYDDHQTGCHGHKYQSQRNHGYSSQSNSKLVKRKYEKTKGNRMYGGTS